MLRLYSLIFAAFVIFGFALAQGTDDANYDPVKVIVTMCWRILLRLGF
jgi:hypothetical protein